MKSGYNIFWTNHAIIELESTIEYLENNFTEKQIAKLVQKIESTVNLISRNPFIFPQSDKTGVFKVTILKYNTMYYRIEKDNIEIVSFFSNRQNPNKRRL